MRLNLSFVVAVGLLSLAPFSSGRAQQQPAATFRAGIDLLTVETTVLDRDGRPVTDLQPSDFSVRVAGQPRKVLFARFYATEASGAPETTVAIAPGVAGHVGNISTSVAAGRIVVFVVDRDSIKTGNEKAMLETAATVLDSLGPGDAAGLVSLPVGSVEITREHDRVRQALEMATGTQPRQALFRERNISWTEALAYENNDPRVIAEVVERECYVTPRIEGVREECPPQLREQAQEMLATGRARVQTAMSVLTRLAEGLAPLRGSKHIVMLSGGLPFGQDLLPYFDEFAKKAAAAQMVFYAVHLDQPDSDASDRKTVASAFGGRDMAQGLATIAGMTGGAFFEGVGRATGVFDRIKVEMNNFYELGVETLPEDAAGQPRDIEVKVSRPGLSVRARRQVTLPDRATLAARMADPVKTLLAQPTDIAELPVAITAYTTRGDEASTLRVLLSGEIGAPQAKAPVDWGFVVLNEGNAVANGRARIDATRPGPWSVTTSAKLTPGKYRLRFVAADADQRTGVADIPLTVGLRVAGELQVSDLIVGTADGGRLLPRGQLAQGAPATALIELYSNDPARLETTTAVLEIIPAGSGEPVQRYLMARRNSPSSAAILIAEGDFATTALAPGRYTASVIALIDNQPVGRVSRVFDVVGRQ